jgi:urea carboxylase
MFRKVLIANRGAIACRIIRTLRNLGVSPIAVYSEADRYALHVLQSDTAILLGPAAAAESYLNQTAILDAAHSSGAEAIHPGYGFLSENADFVDACERTGLVFLGPTSDQMRTIGLKHTAREIAQREGVPLLPGTALLTGPEHARLEAARLGYPVMLKCTGGGGGIGLRICCGPNELDEHYGAVARLGETNFRSNGLYLEQYIGNARHIEVQIFGDGIGGILTLGERDCSAQRRHQKVIEETPAPGLTADVRRRLTEAAARIVRSVKYRSAGTVEFLYDVDRGEAFFLEVNTRLQVEHGVTEEVTGIDLVDWMVRLGSGDLPPLETLRVEPTGASIQVRVYAESTVQGFRPSSGLLTHVRMPPGVRCDTWVDVGTEVTPYYDSLLAKIIVHDERREEAVDRLTRALTETMFAGVETNLHYLRQVVSEPEFRAGGFSTSFLTRVRHRPRAFEVIEPGMQTTVQDYPGRLGFWHVGVPPSGPMDALAFRLANRLVGNAESAPALECTMVGPVLRFHSDACVAITGADMSATLNGEPAPGWRSFEVSAGSELRLGTAIAPGLRSYVAVRGGIDVPEVLGSRSTFMLGKFGGHGGRALRDGDVLRWLDVDGARPPPLPHGLNESLRPSYSSEWTIGTLYGPHGSPDFFTDVSIGALFGASWKVHHHSDRTGVRLIGPPPSWARHDGGDAGLHPSNLHDNAYAVGAMDFTGDMPILLGPDGPSLGGFVCPAVVAHAELWKLGQLRPGDTVRFRFISNHQATRMERQLDAAIATLDERLPPLDDEARGPAVLKARENIVYRASGDRYLLIEIGPNALDLRLRVHVHCLEQRLRMLRLRGIIDITPGIRSLQVHYDSRLLPRHALIAAIESCEAAGPDLDDVRIPARTVRLPLSWEDPATLQTIRRYQQSVRADAPWCPSNIEFIRRINGLGSIDDVRRIVFDARYLVMGLGDVYLGAPVATPLDPRHCLVTTKYNPARTWTAENLVGIGGAYLCVYGMEGPGGYQLVGRTVQMWNTHCSTPDYEPGSPWLLRFFDQIRFFPVSAGELVEMRAAFPHGRYHVDVEPIEFSLHEHAAFTRAIETDAASFRRRRQQAFVAERERWAASSQPERLESFIDQSIERYAEIPDGCEAVRSPVAGAVWRLDVVAGQHVELGQTMVLIAAMKMEIAIVAPATGVVEVVHCTQGSMVHAGQRLVTVKVVAG